MLPVLLKGGSSSEPQNTENYPSNYPRLSQHQESGRDEDSLHTMDTLGQEDLILPWKPG